MDVLGFFNAFTADWVTLMSGIGSVILTIWASIKKWDTVPRSILWTAAAICFLFASARVWTTEHHRALAAEQKLDNSSPKLAAIVDEMITGDNPSTAVAYLLVGVKNTGAPSIAQGWQLSVLTKHGIDHYQANFIPKGEKVSAGDGHVIQQFSRKDALEDRTIVPIQPGS